MSAVDELGDVDDEEAPSPLLSIPVSQTVHSPHSPSESTPPPPLVASTPSVQTSSKFLKMANARPRLLGQSQPDTVSANREKLSKPLPKVSGINRSSLGILTEDAMGNNTFDFTGRASDFFANPFGGADAVSVALDKEITFKVPDVPRPAPREVSVMELPSMYLKPGPGSNSLLQSFLTADASLGDSSFTWENFGMNQSANAQFETGRKSTSEFAASVMPADAFASQAAGSPGLRGLRDPSRGASFFDGQFSGRSTSIGGSNESVGTKTYNERFSDLTKSGKMFDLTKSEPNISTGAKSLFGDFPDAGSMFGDFPAQDFVANEFNDGDIHQDAISFMNQEEKEFEDVHRFDHIPDTTNEERHHEVSNGNLTFLPPLEGSAFDIDFLSRTDYFMRNTSRIGSLEDMDRTATRPTFGLHKVLSPRRAKSASLQSLRSTYTVPETEHFRPAAAAAAGFSGQADVSLGAFAKKASKQQSSTEELWNKYMASLSVGTDWQDKTLNASVVNNLLPSFLESSALEDTMMTSLSAEEVEIVVNGRAAEPPRFPAVPAAVVSPPPAAAGPSALERERECAAKPEVRSRIPLPSTASSASKAKPASQQKQPSSDASKLQDSSARPKLRGQRFSSPIKQAEKASTIVSQKKSSGSKETSRSNLFGNTKENAAPAAFALRPADGAGQSEKKSPLMASDNHGVTPLPDIVVSKAPSKPACLFPVETSATAVSWHPVVKGRSEERVLDLRNVLDSDLTVNLLIRESEDFRLGSSSSRQLTIAPRATRSVLLTFAPSKLGFSNAKLVIKPQCVEFKKTKATIVLQGQAIEHAFNVLQGEVTELELTMGE